MNGIRGIVGELEGGLHVQLKTDSGVVRDVQIRSLRRVDSGALLESRRVADALDLLPRIFSLCGVAQTAAGLEATEHALAISLTAAQTAARRILVAAEALEQTIWRITVDWPTCLGMQPDVSGIRDLRRLLRGLETQMFDATPWNRIGGSRLVPDRAAVANTVEATAQQATWVLYGEAAPQVDDYESFRYWLDRPHRQSASALDYVRDLGLAAFGNCSVELLPTPPDIDYLAQQMAEDVDWSFCSRPHYRGTISETGALSRLADHPSVSTLRDQYGNGLLTRLAARLVETNELITQMRACVGHLSDDMGTTTDVGSGRGIGVIDTARGALVHWVDIVDNVVERYRILAPTEWNFHPQGPLAQGLRGMDAHLGESLDKNAGLLISALDPCVGYELSIEEH